MTEWYLWEKNPGVIGVLPVSKLNDHAEKLVMRVEGSLEDAIKQAELCEKEGYFVIVEENKAEQQVRAEDVVNSEKLAEAEETGAFDKAEENDLPDFMTAEVFSKNLSSLRKQRRNPKRKRLL